LTKKGLENRSLVVQRCFEALKTFSSSPFPSHLVTEQNFLGNIQYQYQTRRDAYATVVRI